MTHYSTASALRILGHCRSPAARRWALLFSLLVGLLNPAVKAQNYVGDGCRIRDREGTVHCSEHNSKGEKICTGRCWMGDGVCRCNVEKCIEYKRPPACVKSCIDLWKECFQGWKDVKGVDPGLEALTGGLFSAGLGPSDELVYSACGISALGGIKKVPEILEAFKQEGKVFYRDFGRKSNPLKVGAKGKALGGIFKGIIKPT